MNAEISLGDIPIPTETQDSVMKKVFQLKDGEIIGEKPKEESIKADIQNDGVTQQNTVKAKKQSTPKSLKQVSKLF